MRDDIRMTVGVDLGDRFSNYCVIAEDGEVVRRTRISTTKKAFSREFPAEPKVRIALEVGTHSPWVSRLLQDAGHEVIVADPHRLALISKNHKKSDESDAELLARLARTDLSLISPIEHRSATAQADLTVIRARDTLVAARTKLINMVRCQVKSNGARMKTCSAESFHKEAVKQIPEAIRLALEPVVGQIKSMTDTINDYDRQVNKLASEKYKATELLCQVSGVAALTALTFVLTIDRPERFAKSRDVGAFLGLVPAQHASGAGNPQMRITKRGDGLMRRLLVGSAHYILGPFGHHSPSDLRDWGLSLAARGGKNAKKRAVIAVARKLAVLLHRLWTTGQAYDPRRRAADANARNSSAQKQAANPCAP